MNEYLLKELMIHSYEYLIDALINKYPYEEELKHKIESIKKYQGISKAKETIIEILLENVNISEYINNNTNSMYNESNISSMKKNNNFVYSYEKKRFKFPSWLVFILLFPVGIGITMGFNLIKQTPSMIPTLFKRGATDAEIRYVLKIVADAYTYKIGVEDCKHYSARFWYEMNKMGIRCDYVSNARMQHAYNRVKLKDGSYIFVEPQAYNYGEVESYLLEDMWDKIPDINTGYFVSGLNLSIDYLISGKESGSKILPKPPEYLIYRK